MNTQSYVSTELTHFVGRNLPDDEDRCALLMKILREGWLQPSPCGWDPGASLLSGGSARLSTGQAVKVTVLCFCDIPRGQLQIHMKKYGPFGIAFPKQMLLRRGANPVHYVARNAKNIDIGVGPQTTGDRLDELHLELQRVRFGLEQYVARVDGAPAFVSKLSPPNTPEGHQLLGRLAALVSEIQYLVFGQIKFFTEGLPDDDPENFYMEREWRMRDGLSFRPEDVARIILPADYASRFRADLPDYARLIDPA